MENLVCAEVIGRTDVRELKAMVERATLMCEGDCIFEEDFIFTNNL